MCDAENLLVPQAHQAKQLQDYAAILTLKATDSNQAMKLPIRDHIAVRESVNKSAASAASPDYVKFQAVIKSAAGGASPSGGRGSGRLDHGPKIEFVGRASGQKKTKKSSKSQALPRSSESGGICCAQRHLTGHARAPGEAAA